MTVHFILTTAETAAADRAAIDAGTPGFTLMRRAGGAVAEAISRRWSKRRVLVLCGPGNNGGDGFVVARLLAETGWPVTLALAGDPARLHGDAALAAEGWRGKVAAIGTDLVDKTELVVDALFGAGLSKPLDEPLANVLRAAEAADVPIVGVDLPSGLSGDLGRPLGYAARCALTVTFHARKPAHVLQPGRGLCGEVVVADIGLGEHPTALFENDPGLWGERFPWPSTSAHKTERGRLIVVSGNHTSTGAARLASRAGLRVGAGVVTVLSPPDAIAANAAHLEAVMLKPFANAAELAAAAQGSNAVVIGPAAGVTPATAENVRALAATSAHLIVDADALTVFRDEPAALFALLDEHDVMTPHPGEFERVFPGLLASTPERISAARQAAARAGAVVLLKGPDTVIAAPDGRCVVNLNGSPWLATAGSGDVLAGFIGGLIAQGMASFEAACAGAWIHAEAGASHGPGLISEDLPGLAPVVLNGLWERSPLSSSRP